MDFHTFVSGTLAGFYEFLWLSGVILLAVVWAFYEISTVWHERQADRRRRNERRERWKSSRDWRP